MAAAATATATATARATARARARLCDRCLGPGLRLLPRVGVVLGMVFLLLKVGDHAPVSFLILGHAYQHLTPGLHKPAVRSESAHVVEGLTFEERADFPRWRRTLSVRAVYRAA